MQRKKDIPFLKGMWEGLLRDKFDKASKRIIVATFSSHIHRIQQVLDVSAKMDKKVAISGKSMLKDNKDSQ